MKESDFQTLKVDQRRMMETLHHTCSFGTGHRWGQAATETGMKRLALSDSDKKVRDWFVDTTKSLGCEITIDKMGNIFAVRPGRRQDVAPIFVGSHLDTQPTGGRYDGILGILAGVETLKVLQDANVETEYPIGVVNWTNEEGARFPMTMVSSGVWAEAISLEAAHGLKEVGGTRATLLSELKRQGYLGETPASYRATPMSAHFELHIEQGPILEMEKQKIGVVNGVQAYKWYTIEVEGRAAHTGTTPYGARADALLGAARMIAHSNKKGHELSALASTGILTLEPGSTNTIANKVSFSLDIRAPDNSTVEAMEAQLKKDFTALAGEEPVPLSVIWRTDSNSPAVKFHKDCIDIVRQSADAVLGNSSLHRDMTSGAGHDSVYTSRHCPTTMIFVPSKNGVSHHPEEWTSDEDCALGAEVLCQSVIRYDRKLAGATS
ncbi:amidase [Macroventuria anomochaeta]|uniref:Amidase n=1 Tax=Macroventuria anomochaeta TaxID=301207 RepID=A0ACB6S7D2_9PLEO|nr:amidase [Macroventuria anomochaeta]KAF2629264.1 amidase [Macroventuria anomochaeta]